MKTMRTLSFCIVILLVVATFSSAAIFIEQSSETNELNEEIYVEAPTTHYTIFESDFQWASASKVDSPFWELRTQASRVSGYSDLEGPVIGVTIHHCAGTYGWANDPADGVNQVHKGNDWPGAAYDFIIGLDGTIYHGGPLDSLGWHAGDYRNINNIAISFEGNFNEYAPNEEQYDAGGHLIAHLVSITSITDARTGSIDLDIGSFDDVTPHGSWGSYGCPGQYFSRASLEYYYNLYMDGSDPAEFVLDHWSVDPQRVESGEPVTIEGRVENVGGETQDIPVELHIGGSYTDTHWVYNLGPGETEWVTFTHSENELGIYDVFVGLWDVDNYVWLDTWENSFEVVEPLEVQITSPTEGQIFDVDEVTVEWTGGGMDYFRTRLNEGEWLDVDMSTSHTFTDLADGTHTADVEAVRGNTGGGEETQDDSYESTTHWLEVTNDIDRGQRFVPIGSILTRLELPLYSSDTSSYANIAIRANDDGQTPSVPQGGSPMWETSITMPTEGSWTWVSIDVNSVSLNPGSTYWITIDWEGGDSMNWMGSHDVDSDPAYSNDGGTSWHTSGTDYSYAYRTFTMDAEEQEDDSFDGITHWLEVTNNIDRAQRFVPQRSRITRLELPLYGRGDTSSNLHIGLREDDDSISPTVPQGGTPMWETSITLPDGGTYQWISVDVEGVELTPGNTYWITVDWEGAEYINWMGTFDYDSDPAYSSDGGSSWHTSGSEYTYGYRVFSLEDTGETVRDSVSFTVNTASLSVYITAPQEGELLFTDSVNVVWEGTAGDHPIDYYEIRLNTGGWINVGTNTAYIFSDLSDGGHFVEVRVFDVESNSETDSISFTVDTSERTHTLYGFWPYWTDPADYEPDWGGLTHVAYFGLYPQADGSLVNSSMYRYEDVRAMAHANGVEVTISLPCFDKDTQDSILAYHRQTLADNILDALEYYNADGVNLDFEFPRETNTYTGESNAVLYEDLMERIHNTLKTANPNYHISFCIAGGVEQIYRNSNLAQYVEDIFMMGYDYHWRNAPTTGPVSPFADPTRFDVTNSVNILRDYYPDHKIILGLPFYGYDWPCEDDQPGSSTTGAGTSVFMKDAIVNAQTYGRNWDENSNTPWYVYYDGEWRQTWYEDDESLGLKWDYVVAEGLSGTGYWALGYEHQEIWDLVKEKFTTEGELTHDLQLVEGWNFVSFNLIPVSSSLTSILDNGEYGVGGNYDRVMYYDASVDQWKSYVPGRPEHYNNLSTWDHRMGLWIYMLSNMTLTVEGNAPTSTDITLYPGWNMVGLPSTTSGNHGLPVEIDKLGYFDGAATYKVAYNYDPANFEFEPGNGYWIHNPTGAALTWSLEWGGPESPYDPDPHHGAEDVNTNPVLSVAVYHPGDTMMDVYFYNANGDTLIGIDENVASGTRASVTWSGLEYNTSYNWYAVADDGYEIAVSDTWQFTTEPEDANFILHGWSVSPEVINPGESVTISGQVENIGGQTDSDYVDLYVNNDFIDDEYVTLGPGESTTVTFVYDDTADPGIYDVLVDLWSYPDDWEDSFEVVSEPDEPVVTITYPATDWDTVSHEGFTASGTQENCSHVYVWIYDRYKEEWVDEGYATIEGSTWDHWVSGEVLTAGNEIQITAQGYNADYGWGEHVHRFAHVDEPEDANFILHGWSASPSVVDPGETVTISGQVENIGGQTDNVPIELYIDSTYTGTIWVYDLGQGQTETVTFYHSEEAPGTYNVWVFEFYDGVGDEWHGSFEVVDEECVEEQDDSWDTPASYWSSGINELNLHRAQAFRPQRSVLTRIELPIHAASGTASAEVSIRADNGGVPSSTAMAVTTVHDLGEFPGYLDWTSISFSESVVFTPGNTYWITVGNIGDNIEWITETADFGYPHRAISWDGGSTWDGPWQDHIHLFRTFTCADGSTGDALAGKIIAIDPGHGGSDSGAVGWDPDPPYEKHFALWISETLRDLLESEGAEVVMTRTGDYDVSLADRCNIANNAGADIFVSVHLNSAVETAHGTETFYYGCGSTYSVNGKDLGEKTQARLVARLGTADRRCMGDCDYFGYHLYVLANTHMPAILTETVFISNENEYNMMLDEYWRDQAAMAHFEGILEYFGVATMVDTEEIQESSHEKPYSETIEFFDDIRIDNFIDYPDTNFITTVYAVSYAPEAGFKTYK